MDKRPILNMNIDKITFRNYYYLKEELVDFCRTVGLPTSGGKIEITDRISSYLDTGEILISKPSVRCKTNIYDITENTQIELNFICSEKHRAFFKEKIGKSFSFNIVFQKWLKANRGETYKEAIAAYYQIIAEKKKGITVIGKQFEYNAYIRLFFIDNSEKSLEEAIICWKYKKSLQGHNRYEKSDLIVLLDVQI